MARATPANPSPARPQSTAASRSRRPGQATPPISDAEWQVMDLLWRRGPAGEAGTAAGLTSGQIADALSEPNGWSPRTVKTLLARLVKKGAVHAQPGEAAGHAGYLYRAAIPREQAAGREGHNFLQRVFGGAVTPAVAQLLDGARLTPDEAQKLREMIDQAEHAPPPGRPTTRAAPDRPASGRSSAGTNSQAPKRLSAPQRPTLSERPSSVPEVTQRPPLQRWAPKLDRRGNPPRQSSRREGE